MVALQHFADAARLEIGKDRLGAQMRVLRFVAAFMSPESMLTANGHIVQDFLDARAAKGVHVNTLRKERTMIRSFFTWAWENGYVDAHTLLSIRSVPPPAGSTPLARPRPYSRKELQTLWATLDARWPKVPSDEADRWLRRFEDG